jgi:hypothetical protein
MFWIFKNKWISYKNTDLHAKIVEVPREPIDKPLWWGNEPINDPDLKFEFLINSHAPYIDNYSTGTTFWLFSERLINIMKMMNVHFETFPTTVYDSASKEKLDLGYKVFRLLSMESAIDKEKTSYEIEKLLNFPRPKNLVLNDEFMNKGIPMTRCESELDIVLIHENIKTQIEKKGITGCRFMALDGLGASMAEAMGY